MWDVDRMEEQMPFALFLEWCEYFELLDEWKKEGEATQGARSQMREAQEKIRGK